MGTSVMMYVLPMMLGQTYHLGKERPGLHIFPTDINDKAEVVENYFTDSQYLMVENSEEVKDFLSASGKLSLKIKGGMLDVSGEGSYLKESGLKENGMEILVKVHFETITKTIPTSVKPHAGWSQMDKDFLGTHFCRSITYGGDLIASVRITGSSSYDLMRIKAALNGEVKAKAFEANLKGKLDLLEQNTQDSSSMEINYYATVPISRVSYDIDGLLKLVDEFPSHVMKVNNGTGNPLRMELYPLSSLQASWPSYFENRALTDVLDDLDSQFDDLRNTRRRMSIWMASLPPVAPADVEDKIGKFTDKINTIYGEYLKTIADLDVTVGASMKPITDAFDAYKAGEYIMPQKYVRQMTELQNEIYEAHPELKPRVGGSNYVHWGRSECPNNDTTEPSVVGVMTASEVQQNGGSSNFLCAPFDPMEVDLKDYFPGYPGDDDPDEHILISPLIYDGKLKRFESMEGKRIACVHCRVAHRTTVLVTMADTHCPTDKWTKEYEGILMAPNKNSAKGEYICMDKEMGEPIDQAKFGSLDQSHLIEILEVSVKCGSLPCGPYAEDKPIPCVVCTI